MAAIVICGDAHTAPDMVVGLFETLAEAEKWADRQAGERMRYAVPMVLIPPAHFMNG